MCCLLFGSNTSCIPICLMYNTLPHHEGKHGHAKQGHARTVWSRKIFSCRSCTTRVLDTAPGFHHGPLQLYLGSREEVHQRHHLMHIFYQTLLYSKCFLPQFLSHIQRILQTSGQVHCRLLRHNHHHFYQDKLLSQFEECV
jgi:hypothetical protein